MSVEEIILDLSIEGLFNESTNKNKVGAVVGAGAALVASASLTASIPLAVPLLIATGALAGAKGESAVKDAVKGAGSIAANVVRGIAGGIAGVQEVFKSDEEFFNRGVERLQKGEYQGAVEDFTQAINIEPPITKSEGFSHPYLLTRHYRSYVPVRTIPRAF